MQKSYREYRNIAVRYLNARVEEMKKKIKGKGDINFDGRWISLFAHCGENVTYPSPPFVENLVTDMKSIWSGILSTNPELTRFVVNFESQVKHSGYPQLMIQIYEP